jgi:type I restriction enzyme S subunit
MIVWEEKTLNELGKVGRGKSRHRPRNAPHLYGGDYPFIQTGDVQAAPFYINSFSQTYSEDGLAQSKIWEKNTLCISIVGANTAATGILGFDACFPDSVIGFIPNKNVSDVKFVKYSLELLQVHLKNISQGTARENLSLEKLLGVKIPTPPIEYQNKVVSVLGPLDDSINNNLKRIQLLEEMAERIYGEWFVKFEVDKTPLKLNKKTGLPQGWQKKKLADFFEIKTGKRDANFGTLDGEYPFFTCSQEPIKSPSYSFDASAILLAGNGEFSVKMYRGKFEAYQRTYVLIPNEEKNTILLYRSLQFYLRVLTSGSKGSVIKYLTKDMIESFEIIYPDNLTLEKYNSINFPILNQVENLNNSNKLLKAARDILLPQIMTGKIEV